MLLAISLTCALTFPTSLAAFVKSFDLILTLGFLTFGFFGIAALRLFMPFLRPPLEAEASAIAPPALAIATPPATRGTFALLATLPTPCPALLALSPTPPTALRTASIGVLPPLEPLLEPFEFGDFAFGFDFDFDFDDLELADFGFALFVDFDFAVFDFVGFADLDFEALGLAFDFDFVLGFELELELGFALLDEPALFDAVGFLDLVSAIFLSPQGVFPIRSGTQSIEGKSR
jgi:hypothetical protein